MGLRALRDQRSYWQALPAQGAKVRESGQSQGESPLECPGFSFVGAVVQQA